MVCIMSVKAFHKALLCLRDPSFLSFMVTKAQDGIVLLDN